MAAPHDEEGEDDNEEEEGNDEEEEDVVTANAKISLSLLHPHHLCR